MTCCRFAHGLQRVVEARELGGEPGLLLDDGVGARGLGADGGRVDAVVDCAHLVLRALAVAFAGGARDEAGEERLHGHDAGADDAHVGLDHGPEVNEDTVVGVVCAGAGGREFGETDDGGDADAAMNN